MLKIMTWKGVKNAKQIYQKILGHPVLYHFNPNGAFYQPQHDIFITPKQKTPFSPSKITFHHFNL